MQAMTDWLNDAENQLSMVPQISRLPPTLEKQIQEHSQFAQDVFTQKEKLTELNNKGSRIQFACEKKDAIPIKNRLISLRHRFDKIHSRVNDRTKNLDNAMAEAQTYFEVRDELVDWMNKASEKIAKQQVEPTTAEKLREILDEHKALQEELQSKKPRYESTEKRGRLLEEHAPAAEKRQITKANEELQTKWNALSNSAFR